jgi:glycopeptide antibiotics resistance protein
VTTLRYVPLEALFLAVLLGVATAAAASLPALRRGDAGAAALTAARVLLAGAILAVLAVTLMSGTGTTGVNLVPGEGIRTALRNANRELGLLNLVGNVVMFAPVGFLLPLATRLRFVGATAVCALLSVAIETVQLTTGRSFDVDDVLLNTAGGALGAAFGVVVAYLLGRRATRRAGAPASPAGVGRP